MGAIIQKKRKALNYTQEQLGQMCGLTRASIINMETGRHGLGTEMIYLFCQILKCKPNDLFPPVSGGKVILTTKTVTVKRQKKIVTAKFQP